MNPVESDTAIEGHQQGQYPRSRKWEMGNEQCNVCGKRRFELIFQRIDFDVPTEEVFSIVKCKSCGLVFVYPQPTNESLGLHYPSNYYSYVSFGVLDRRAKFTSLVRLGAPGFRNQVSNPRRFIATLFYRLFSRIVTIIPYIPNSKLLDVGCGSGMFLWEMKGLGLDPYGVDIDTSAIAFARSKGLKVYHGELSECNFPDQFFDVITLRSVIEHVRNPRRTLSEASRIIKKDGVLILNTPNISSYEALLFGEYWSALETPRHLFLFNLQTLQELLSQCGFLLERVDWLAFTPDLFVKSLKNVKKFGRKSPVRILEIIFKWLILQPVLCVASKSKPSRYGSILTVYARKRNTDHSDNKTALSAVPRT